jgi:hypothetical protein
MDKHRLLLGRQLQVPVALALRCERLKDHATHSELGMALVRAFFGIIQAKGNPSKVVGIHGCLPDTYACRTVRMDIF